MKYIILFLLILNIKTIFKSVKSLFTSRQKKLDELIKLYKDSKENFSKKDSDNSLEDWINVIAIVIGFFYTVFYIICMCYVNSLVFSIITVYLIIRYLKMLGGILKFIKDENTEHINTNKLGTLVNLGWIGYLTYYLILNF